MSSLSDLKQQLYRQLHVLLDEKVEAARSAIASAREARDSETKSSVGDKYETSRAMMQAEMDQHEGQLRKALLLKNELSRVNMDKVYQTSEFGSLVQTDSGYYFMAIGLGKIPGTPGDCYAISTASPIGRLLLGKKAGEKVVLEGREYGVEKIG